MQTWIRPRDGGYVTWFHVQRHGVVVVVVVVVVVARRQSEWPRLFAQRFIIVINFRQTTRDDVIVVTTDRGRCIDVYVGHVTW